MQPPILGIIGNAKSLTDANMIEILKVSENEITQCPDSKILDSLVDLLLKKELWESVIRVINIGVPINKQVLDSNQVPPSIKEQIQDASREFLSQKMNSGIARSSSATLFQPAPSQRTEQGVPLSSSPTKNNKIQ